MLRQPSFYNSEADRLITIRHEKNLLTYNIGSMSEASISWIVRMLFIQKIIMT